jgi:hypothetical protein
MSNQLKILLPESKIIKIVIKIKLWKAKTNLTKFQSQQD